jgi:hypothetical protein
VAGIRGNIGRIDDAGIYNRALTGDEILRNYRAAGLAVELAGKLTLTWGEIKAFQPYLSTYQSYSSTLEIPNDQCLFCVSPMA